MKAATRLQGIRDEWAVRKSDLSDALTYNRRLWTVLVSSATRPENPLPEPVKANIGTLGMFIFNQTMAIHAEPEPTKLAVLVNINREIAAGLRTMAQAA